MLAGTYSLQHGHLVSISIADVHVLGMDFQSVSPEPSAMIDCETPSGSFGLRTIALSGTTIAA